MTNLGSIRTFRHPMFPKTVSWLVLFFADSYSKMALTSKKSGTFFSNFRGLLRIPDLCDIDLKSY